MASHWQALHGCTYLRKCHQIYFLKFEKLKIYQFEFVLCCVSDAFTVAGFTKQQKIWRASKECLVYILKQQFSVFKQHFISFNEFFHPHVFL